MGSGGDGVRTVGARVGQQGVRARVGAAGKALDGYDRQTLTDKQILRPLYADTRYIFIFPT